MKNIKKMPYRYENDLFSNDKLYGRDVLCTYKPAKKIKFIYGVKKKELHVM